MKHNLADITALDNYSDTLSILEYETISSPIREMENSLALVMLLQTIKENSPFFKTIISTEIGYLQESIEISTKDNNKDSNENSETEAILKTEHAIDNCIFLSKLKDIFDDSTKAEHIIVYNSLTKSTPETKAVEYFNEEMIILRNIVREEIRDFMSQYQSITRSDESFKRIKDVSHSLSSLIIKLNKLSKDSMRKSASAFLSQKNIEDQFAFFGLFFQEHVPRGFSKSPNLISHQETKKNESSEDIIDAEVSDVEVEYKNGNNHREKTEQTEQKQVEEFTKSLQEVVCSMEKIKEDIYSIKESNLEENAEPTIQNNIDKDKLIEEISQETKQILQEHEHRSEQKTAILNERIDAVDEKISVMSDTIMKLSANFNSFIENQTNFTKIIKERYDLNI
jgi:hypothetical protein